MLSVTRDSSPGDSDSACSATNQQPDRQRRTRASKPKVRTGCITCKIRRVKCDEGKPACARCTSTGRHCDGYDSTASPSRGLTSPARAEEAQRGAEQARRQFLREYSGNAALQGLRPIVADIEGSEMERRFFHHFRSAAAGGFQASTSTAAGPFWTRVAPEMARRDGAVKHALIALGAAYRLFQQSSVEEYSISAEGGIGVAPGISIESPPRENKIGAESPEELELFTIQQYNHSIALLQTHASSSSLDSIRVTLVCCLAFIFLEMLRSKETAALTHLTNGLRILESLPREAFDSVTATGHPTGSDPHMDDIIRMFCRLECSATLFAANIRPSIALRSYHQALSSSSGGGENPISSWLPPARSIIDVHERCNRHACNVIARIYETREHYADATFWSDPHQRRQQEILCARSRSLREVVRAFVASDAASGLEAADVYALDLDLLHLLCMDMFAQAMTGLPRDDDDQDSNTDLSKYSNVNPRLRSHPRHQYGLASGSVAYRSAAGPSNRSQALLKEILGVAGRLMETAASIRRGRQRQDRDQAVAGFTHEAGVLPPLYLVATIAEDSAVRQAALDMLEGAKVREGFWDGPSLYRLVLCVGDKVAQGRWPFHVVPSSLTGLGAIPDMWRLLERMDLEEDVQ
ncbi:hypothetical protein MGG_01779 [Pyricularia oryzae 70-15]|uniref:Zn(2)-C6 fungal-type domain-containing protein n=4 Tax=Pyricularia oryzae TaxID=318829 RepID=G4MVR0_PYRO7|nr:uncharacterized protein MGG_01779 [Pyricularia oryzae 70-15]AEK70431.1 Prg2 [Pyricularia oryzae]EHA54976.1 hypothetical protein MGG_01779 [Pyricularia oryzae 70-15]ELQ37681.1 hypothetical protein OOU_Y34scaffold00584g14 [Pyricularia oryzae Y34]